MPAPKPYNGHHCWNCWNVSLWIANDEPLYRAAVECRRRPRASGKPGTLAVATRRFFAEVLPQGSRTPDGAKYTWRAVCHALEGLE